MLVEKDICGYFDMIAGNAFDLVTVLSKEGIIILENQTVSQLLGYQKDERKSYNITDFIHPGEVKNVQKELQKEGQSSFEFRMKHKKGYWLWMEGRKQVYINHPEINGIILYARNITELKNKEWELHEREKEFACIEKFTRSVEIKDDLSHIFEDLVYILKESMQYPDITGVRIIQDGSEYQTSNFKETPWKLYAEIISDNKTKGTIEIVYLKKMPEYDDGPFLKEERVLLDMISERLGRIIERHQKTTLYEELYDKLNDYSSMLKQAQKIAQMGSWELNIKTNELYWSDEIYRIFELNPHEFEATYESFLARIHPDDVEKVNQAYINSLKTKEPYEIDHRLKLKSGEVKYVKERCETEFDESGNPLNSKGIVIDITKNKKNEEQLDKLNANKDKLFSIIGHDLKGPIGSIFNLSNRMEEKYNDFPPDKIKNFSHAISQTSKSILALLENLLTWSRAQRQKINIQKEEFLVGEVVNDCINLLANNASQKQIQLLNNIPPETMVYADKKMITTVVRNLISNAIKFTNLGGEVTVFAETKKNKVIVGIKDTGIGITQEIKTKLFEPDKTKSNDGTAGEKGTGLGLLICKDFLELNNGKVWVESEEGQGTTFYFEIPYGDI